MNTQELTIAGRFVLGDFIRQGGMGEVFRGRDTQTGEVIAIKRLKNEILIGKSDSVERFIREGDVLRTLNHPNIVKIIATAEEGGNHYLIMEFMRGGSLADLLRTEMQLSVIRTLQIALDLADALTRAHRLNVIHRDIKPDNVLLAEDGSPRLTDFGLARLSTSTITQNGIMLGTYRYLSPEAFNSQTLDARADIWSFGVMLFEMLAGRNPFQGDSPGAVMTAVLTKKVPDLEAIRPDVPPALADLIYRMLDKSLQQRIQSMRIVGVELETTLQTLLSAATAAQALERSAFVASKQSTSSTMINNLPGQNNAFIGRAAELKELKERLADAETRLVTISAPGGMGKTRLALELARSLVEDYKSGVFFVALAPLSSPDLIVTAIAEAIRFTFYEGTSPKSQLVGYLHSKNMLLVLDNFDHLLAGAELLSEILQTAPRVNLIVTSRERLNIHNEWVFSIDGMAVPELNAVEDLADFDSVKLFLQSAHGQNPNFQDEPKALRQVARICRLVYGMPLGIELAAAWVEMLTLPEIIKEIETNLDFLETEMRDVPERQRSLRAVFEQTWNMLDSSERDAFKRLSVFRGGFTRDAAQQVADAALRTLMRLMNKSLLRRDRTGRYEVHELLRQYAEERLNATADERHGVYDKHRQFYITFLQQHDARLKGYGQKDALDEIETELDNVRAAWVWALAQKDIASVGPALEPLWNFYVDRDRLQEGEQTLRKAVEVLHGIESARKETAMVGLLLALHGVFCRRIGMTDDGDQHITEGVALLTRLDAKRELAIANLWNPLGTLAETIQRLRDCRTEFEALADRWGWAPPVSVWR